jgi:hypothetical protein
MDKRRLVLFLMGCMSARVGLTYVVRHYARAHKNLLTWVLLIPALGFSYIYRNDLRKTGAEVFGGRIWWNNLRPFHALMYFATALLVHIDHDSPHYPIALDTFVGLLSFIYHHTQ